MCNQIKKSVIEKFILSGEFVQFDSANRNPYFSYIEYDKMINRRIAEKKVRNRNRKLALIANN